MSLRLGVSSGQKATEERVDGELFGLVTRLTNEIDWYMRERKLTRVDLAHRMGVSPGRISQILSGGENLTLRTLAGVATALDAHFDIELKPSQAVTETQQVTQTPAAVQASAPASREIRTPRRVSTH
ncbi:MAG TPA: helix-turn-helix transcriptional regulator [Streptosporangiaceae bacterium]